MRQNQLLNILWKTYLLFQFFSRYFSSRHEIDGVRTSTPCCTPLPHEIPDREIRRASDPVRTQDPCFTSLKSLQRYHSLNAMKPLPTPANMHSLKDKSGVNNSNDTGANDIGGSSNTFHSSRSSIATDGGLTDGGVKDKVTEAELEEKMLEDSEDLIIPDEMRRFLNERYKGETTGQASHGEGSSERLPGLQEFGELDLNFDTCDLGPEGQGDVFPSSCPSKNGSSCMPEQIPRGANMVAGNLQLQIGFADLQQGSFIAGSSPGGAFDQFSLSPSQQQTFVPNATSNGPWPDIGECIENSTQHLVPGGSPRFAGTSQQISGSLQQQLHIHHSHLQQQQESVISMPGHMAAQPLNSQNGIANSASTCNTLGKNCTGHGAAVRSGMDSQHSSGIVPHGAEMPLGGSNQTRIPWEGAAGSGAYLSQHNLMQHQLQQQYRQQQAAHDSSMPYFIPHPPPHRPSFHHHHYHNPRMMLSPLSSLGGFSPAPPLGEKPLNQRQKRASPQVQVPHISQSQIPANAKAASRGQTLVKQQQQQQQVISNRSSLISPHHNLHMSHPQDNHPGKLYPHQNTLAQGLYSSLYHHSQHCPYPPNHHPSLGPSHGNMPGPGVMSGHFQGNNHNHYTSMNHISGPGQIAAPNRMQNQNHAPCPNNLQNVNLTNQLQNLPHHHPSLVPSQSSCPGQLPSQYGRNNSYNPMEMSPGCNQVTSSTDCKETTAPPIEDFMDNLTSISAENLLDNIHSISQENIAYSPTPISMRSASQSSGRFSALMNTSNMVINDMSSVLTQLAEENRYLNMRP